MTAPVEPPTPSGETPAPEPAAGHPPGEPPAEPKRRVVEEKMPPALWVRLLIYFVGVHFFAGFLYLLFVLGAHNK